VKEWHLNIPKIFHVYWGGDILPYMRYLTVKTFMKHNPEWKVMLWQPIKVTNERSWYSHELSYDVLCDSFLSELMNLPIEKTAVNFENYGLSNEISEVFKCDFLKPHCLYTYGGVWSDMDIIYFKPITNLMVNIPENKDKEVFVHISWYGFSNGFLMGAVNNSFFRKMESIAKQELNPLSYQCIGPNMYNKFFKTIASINTISPAVNMEMSSVYPYNATEIEQIVSGGTPFFSEGTIGLHWYAGASLWGKFLKDTNGGKDNLGDNIISNIIKNEKE
jgi:mannosyltransferase OCH1-like enzyme